MKQPTKPLTDLAAVTFGVRKTRRLCEWLRDHTDRILPLALYGEDLIRRERVHWDALSEAEWNDKEHALLTGTVVDAAAYLLWQDRDFCRRVGLTSFGECQTAM